MFLRGYKRDRWEM